MIYFFDVFNNFMIKIENDNRTRFLTKFEVSSNDIYRLCNFLAYIQKPRVSLSLSQKISYFWKDLLESSFVGFGPNIVYLKSGNNFPSSVEINIFPKKIYSQIFFLFNIFKKILYRLFSFNYDKSIQNIIFNNIIGKIKFNSNLFKIHPQRYLDYFYLLNQVKRLKKKLIVLEIGGGLSISSLILNKEKLLTKYINIDLPNQIITSFLFLRSNSKLKIALPNEVSIKNIKKFDIILLLPHQKKLLRNTKIDLALNISSFQEMQIETVNEYLSFVHQRLKKGGIFLSLNQTISHYIKNNNFNNCNIKKFKIIKINHNLPFEIKNPIIKKKPNFRRTFLNLVK